MCQPTHKDEPISSQLLLLETNNMLQHGEHKRKEKQFPQPSLEVGKMEDHQNHQVKISLENEFKRLKFSSLTEPAQNSDLRKKIQAPKLWGVGLCDANFQKTSTSIQKDERTQKTELKNVI